MASPRISYLLSFLTVFGSSKYTQFAQIVERQGYTSEKFEATTSDGFILDVLRIQGKIIEAGPRSMEEIGTDFEEDLFGFHAQLLQSGESQATTRPAILLMHGEDMNADDWVLNQGRLETLPFILANLGYDVWVGNNRGVDDYSRHQSLTDTDAAYWDYSFVEMGTLDLPAMIDTIKTETGLEKVTYMGYSRGNTQMFYALAKMEEEYFAASVDKFVAIAPCIYPTRSIVSSYDGFFSSLKEADVHVVYGPGWKEQQEKLCEEYSEPCNFFGSEKKGQPISVKDMAHSSQNYFSGRMQEFIDGIYLRGQESEAAPVETIDKVPIFYVAGKKDDHCNYDTTKYFFKEVIQSSKRLLKQGKLSHKDFLETPSSYQKSLTRILGAISGLEKSLLVISALCLSQMA